MIDPVVWSARAAVLIATSRAGLGLAFEHATALGGQRMVFGAQDTLEVRITKMGHAFIVAGDRCDPLNDETLASATGAP